MADTTFTTTFKTLTDHAPFPWQIDLYEKWVAKGEPPHSCNLATGLGKTSIIAIWLIVLINHPDKAPRRLVYVVNRRTVVDQTTDEVEKIRKNLCKLEGLPKHAQQLAISTLRGQFADNHEWSADPSRPAVICGTVDMIGSRLLFSGYGVGFKAKPLHAGLLGQDVLLVHDEAHLEPAFQELLVAIEKEQQEGERSQRLPWPKLRVMELTATSRRKEETEKQSGLTDEEKNPPEVIPDPPTEPIHHVWRRQKAKKTVHLHTNDDASKLPEQIVRLALEHKDSGRAVLIFLRTVEEVGKVANKLPKESTERLTGTLRGLERDALVKKPVFQRFLPNSNRSDDITPASGTVYLVCTSAGEVGVNISADHMVCDLSTFESMAQRLGRVNRFGDCDDTRIDIVVPELFGKKDKNGTLTMEEIHRRQQKTLELLQRLDGDASPWALGKLDPNDCRAAFAPSPDILPVTDILFDAWALTTIREKLPGRPAVEPYLHGISEWQPPETYVAWREEVEVITGALLERYRAEDRLKDLLDDYPLKPHELLRDQSNRAFKHLQALAAKHPEAPVWIVDARDQILVATLKGLTDGDKAAINYTTVLLPPLVGGLTKDGMLDGTVARKQSKASEESEANQPTDAANEIQYDVADEWYEDKERAKKRRVRLWNDEPDDLAGGMALEHEIRIESPDDEEDEPPKIWRWYVKRPEATNEHSKVAYELPLHLDDVKSCATQIAGRLFKARSDEAQKEMAKAVILAAWCHDLGKRRERWQRSLGNDDYPNEVYAKSGSRNGRPALRPREFLRDHYRHEFGSVLDVLKGNHQLHAEFMALNPEMRDLALHLIVAHHGRSRPHFPVEEILDPEHNGQDVAELAIETTRRFARLQRKYGRWGLAYLESLVRASDYFASAHPGKTIDEPTEKEVQP